MKAEGHKRSYCHTHTKHESKVEFHYVRVFSRHCWSAVPKALSMPIVNWPCNRIKAEQQHVVFPNTQSWLFGGARNRTWCGCTAWGGVFWTAQRWWCHFRNLHFSLVLYQNTSYFLQKKGTGDEVRNILGTDQLIYLFLMYLDAEKAQETHLQQWIKLAAEDISNSHLLTLTELPAPSDMLHQGSHSTDLLTRSLVCCSLFISVRKSHFSGWLLSSAAFLTWDWWSQGLVPLLAAQITSLNSSSRGLSICT